MNRYKDREIETIFSKVFQLGSLAEQALADAMWALANRDRALALKIREGDDTVDELAAEINAVSFATIARHQPVAFDLRALEAAIRMALDLERIADYAVNIARLAGRMETVVEPPEGLRVMGGLVLRMLGEAMRALRNRDLATAEAVFPLDDELDDREGEVFSLLLGRVIEKSELTNEVYGLISAARILERAGDHVTNICEQICYMVAGKRVKASSYRRPKAETR